MFCPNCGNDCGNAKFCSECGTKLNSNNSVKPDLENGLPSIFQTDTDGKEINMLHVVCKYGTNTGRAYGYLKREYGVSKKQAKELFKQYKEQVASNNVSYTGVSRRTQLEESGQVYCPKCLSTSISANQKGFGFARGAIGATIGLDVGLIAGGIGSKKVICTCLKCGHQWKAGKK